VDKRSWRGRKEYKPMKKPPKLYFGLPRSPLRINPCPLALLLEKPLPDQLHFSEVWSRGDRPGSLLAAPDKYVMNAKPTLLFLSRCPATLVCDHGVSRHKLALRDRSNGLCVSLWRKHSTFRIQSLLGRPNASRDNFLCNGKC
jgi:hypothetical protein